MNIIFYLVLAAIAVLGMLALVLIFWGRIKLPQKKSRLLVNEEVKGNENDGDDEWQDNVRVTCKSVPPVETRIDPSLGDLGFSANDLLENDDITPVATIAPVSKAPVKKASKLNELIVLYILADSKEPFVGYELLQTLLSAGLRYGEMSIFHYYQQTPNGQGEVLFSVASAVEPGVFDLANVGAIVCPGLTLFMSPQIESSVNGFETLLDIAYQLADDLNGVLCDAQRVPLTETKITEYRNKILENSF